MEDPISNLGDVVVHWIEKQSQISGIIRKMEQDNLIINLVNALKQSGKPQTQKWQKYQNSSGVEKDYLCFVMAYPDTGDGDSQFRVSVRPKDDLSEEWHAIGEVYARPFPENIAQLLKEEQHL